MQGGEAREGKQKSPTPEGMGLLHVFLSPGFTSESGRGPKAPPRWGLRATVDAVGAGRRTRRGLLGTGSPLGGYHGFAIDLLGGNAVYPPETLALLGAV